MNSLTLFGTTFNLPVLRLTEKYWESLNQLIAASKAAQPVNDVAVAGHLELERQPIDEQALAAINDYVEVQATDSASITCKTPTIAELLASLQLQELTGAMRRLTLAATIALSCQRLASQTEQEQFKEQAFEEIASYFQEASIEAALIPHLPHLTGQVARLHAQLSRPTEQLDLKSEQFKKQAFKEIASYFQEAAIEAALIQHLPHLTGQVALLSSAMNNFTEYVDNYQQEKPTQAAEPIAETIFGSGLSTASDFNSTPSPEMLAAQFLILTDQILAPDAVYQELGLRIERSQGQIRASIQGEPVDLQKLENLATIVNRLQALVDEFELLSLYEEFALAARREASIANQAKEIVQINGGNYYAQRLSVEITGSCCEIQFDQKVVFRSTPGNVSRPDDLLQLSDLNLQLLSTTAELQQRLEAQIKQEQARLLAEELKAQSKSARTSTITPRSKERDGGITL